MKLLLLLVLLSTAVALASAAPPFSFENESFDEEDYYNYSEEDYEYDDEDDDDDDENESLSFDIFRDNSARPPKRGSANVSTCSWAVIQCCDVPDRMGSRAHCFDRLGCKGAWFTDICTPQIKHSVLRAVLSSLNKQA